MQVATQAKILADADISILYLSTFFSDFTLVQRADVGRAVEAFESAGFTLSGGAGEGSRSATAKDEARELSMEGVSLS